MALRISPIFHNSSQDHYNLQGAFQLGRGFRNQNKPGLRSTSMVRVSLRRQKGCKCCTAVSSTCEWSSSSSPQREMLVGGDAWSASAWLLLAILTGKTLYLSESPSLNGTDCSIALETEHRTPVSGGRGCERGARVCRGGALRRCDRAPSKRAVTGLGVGLRRVSAPRTHISPRCLTCLWWGRGATGRAFPGGVG